MVNLLSFDSSPRAESARHISLFIPVSQKRFFGQTLGMTSFAAGNTLSHFFMPCYKQLLTDLANSVNALAPYFEQKATLSEQEPRQR